MNNKKNKLDTSQELKFMSETNFNRKNLSSPPPSTHYWAPFSLLENQFGIGVLHHQFWKKPKRKSVFFLGGPPLEFQG